MNKGINKLMFVAVVLVLILSIIAGYFMWETYETNNSLDIVRNNLNTTLNELDIIENNLSNTRKKLQEEIFKSSNLEKSLASVNKEVEKANSELDIANTTIEDLKGDEYKLVYIGDFKLTHYCCEEYEHICGTGNGITATGTKVTAGRTIAVDPKVIPYGTKVYIEGFGWRIAEDCGGGVNNNHIDIAVGTHNEALSIGTSSGGVWMLVENS